MTCGGKFGSLLDLLQPKYNIEVAFKNKSTFMKILSVIVYPFNRRFMTEFATTIGNTVYFPSLDYVLNNSDAATCVLAHETVHIYDTKHLFWAGSIGYNLGYLFPQILSVLALLAILGNWWLLSLAFLVFLFPMPSPFRMKIECRGYNMSAFYSNVMHKPMSINTCIDIMCGLSYYCKYSKNGKNKWKDKFNKYTKELVGKHPIFIDVAYWKNCVSWTH